VRLGAWIRQPVPDQGGFALIALLALAALISAFLIASALNFTSAGISNEREDRSMSALRKAKAALIAYAANEQWQLYKTPGTYFQPGALPCPDQDDDGDPDCTGSTTASMIGRLPFKTLGIDDLRDASGERLWYALSHDFRKMRCTVPPAAPVNGCTRINSDTLGQLTVTGTAPASNVVAVLFAPGAALSTQNRPSDPLDPAHNSPTNYLEGFNLDNPLNVNYVFTSNALPSDTFNDRVLVITQADLMAAVEPAVAANIERDVKPLLGDYFNKWGAYPFAVPFASPPVAQGAYLGSSSPQTTMGLLPVTNTATFIWQNPTVTQIPPGDGSSTVTSWSCSISSLTATCTVNYSGSGGDRPDIRLEVLLANASAAFADQPAPVAAAVDLAMLDGYGNTPGGTPYGYWSAAGSPSRVPTGGTFVAQVGGWSLTYTGRLQNAQDMNHQATIIVPLPAPSYLPRLTNTSSTNPNITWFTLNQWYRQTYYAISSGYAPGSVGSCNPPVPTSPACLTVNNLPGTTNNKQAILVFAGRALDGQTHPSPNPKNYLEGENCNLTAGKDLDIGSSPSTCNLTTSDYVFEHRAGTATTINDRVVVVSP